MLGSHDDESVGVPSVAMGKLRCSRTEISVPSTGLGSWRSHFLSDATSGRLAIEQMEVRRGSCPTSRDSLPLAARTLRARVRSASGSATTCSPDHSKGRRSAESLHKSINTKVSDADAGGRKLILRPPFYLQANGRAGWTAYVHTQARGPPRLSRHIQCPGETREDDSCTAKPRTH